MEKRFSKSDIEARITGWHCRWRKTAGNEPYPFLCSPLQRLRNCVSIPLKYYGGITKVAARTPKSRAKAASTAAN